MSNSPITTHVLDTARGRPAVGVPVTLERRGGDAFSTVGSGVTDDDGRVGSLLPPGELAAGTYRITFDVAGYFAARGASAFYTSIPIVFEVAAGAEREHFHVPLLLNPFGYSTYRGS